MLSRKTICHVAAAALLFISGCGAAGQEQTAAAPEQTPVESQETSAKASTEAPVVETAAVEEASAAVSSEDETSVVSENETSVSSEASTEAEGTSEPEATLEKAASDATEEGGIVIPELTVQMRNLPATEGLQFVRDLRIGWNLGNTLDAHGDWYKGDELGTETIWQPDLTTRALFHEMKEAGFSTIRVPVTWHGHFTDEDYTISEAWMNRVDEVVHYGLDEGLYVIINIHHDNDPESGCLYPDEAHRAQSIHYVERIWTQVAERFADCDEHLIFEAMNEPRLVGTSVEWNLDTKQASCREAVDVINALNQRFVDVVRASGGNNATRWLTCPGYAASVNGVICDEFKLPDDPAGRVILEVHAYTPYAFALDQNGTDHIDIRSKEDMADLTWTLDTLYNRFTSKGIPVLIDEFGALIKGDNLQDRVDFTAYYIARARARGISCCWWDNNAFDGDGEKFGLIHRNDCTWVFPEIRDALMRYADA
ncbi:MAG: cellulase family glycosylhydrolase [Butyrivibrio sp.]|nr:cellulase family glycosylhydrolase [Butyrivibrio sp.]